MKDTFYKFYFEDGHVMICRGMSRHEKNVEIRKHGKIVKTEVA